MTSSEWRLGGRSAVIGLPGAQRLDRPTLDRPAAAAAIVLLAVAYGHVWQSAAPVPDTRPATRAEGAPGTAPGGDEPIGPYTGREVLVAGYIGAPWYYRSDVRLERPDGTDVTLKRLGWDGDALYFPIDGGVRAVEWNGSFGTMVDFLHNKAIARLGKGAHGRKLANPVVETVAAEGRIKGQPAPAAIKLTDLLERLEFTHGHNMLFYNGMMRLAALAPGVRPYLGLGAGVAVPHVEVWFPGESKDTKTNEYQHAGPAVQAVAGLELRVGRASYFLEYKFSYAWIRAALTGDKSWKNFNMPGDLLRQVERWWRGEPARHGRVSTTLAAHQILIGGGYWFNRGWSQARPPMGSTAPSAAP